MPEQDSTPPPSELAAGHTELAGSKLSFLEERDLLVYQRGVVHALQPGAEDVWSCVQDQVDQTFAPPSAAHLRTVDPRHLLKFLRAFSADLQQSYSRDDPRRTICAQQRNRLNASLKHSGVDVGAIPVGSDVHSALRLLALCALQEKHYHTLSSGLTADSCYKRSRGARDTLARRSVAGLAEWATQWVENWSVGSEHNASGKSGSSSKQGQGLLDTLSTWTEGRLEDWYAYKGIMSPAAIARAEGQVDTLIKAASESDSDKGQDKEAAAASVLEETKMGGSTPKSASVNDLPEEARGLLRDIATYEGA